MQIKLWSIFDYGRLFDGDEDLKDDFGAELDEMGDDDDDAGAGSADDGEEEIPAAKKSKAFSDSNRKWLKVSGKTGVSS